jgi:hypothetical protein
LTTEIKGYIVSLDPAKLHDFSALSVLRVTRTGAETFNKYKLISLERQRRQPYDVTAAWFKKAFMNPMLQAGGVTFQPIPLIDIGGVGEPTADIIKKMGVRVRGVRYTGGDGFKIEGRNVNVSKVLMVSTFLGVVDGDRFTMPPMASFEGLFKAELRDFRGELGRLGRIHFEASEGKNDDLICSVAQSVYFAEQFIKPKRVFKAPTVVAFDSNDFEYPGGAVGAFLNSPLGRAQGSFIMGRHFNRAAFEVDEAEARRQE